MSKTILRMPLPAGRTIEQLKHHYQVEKSLAARLKAASRTERKVVYQTMYEEMFRQVPDHPRLTRRVDTDSNRLANADNLALILPLLKTGTVFVEFAPGDCQFLADVASHVSVAYGVDISDQRVLGFDMPTNCQLIVYDGERLDGIPEASIDVVYSNQLIEHIHPEDTMRHFELVARLLKAGGRYIFRTPHRFSGPHDVSQFFSDEPEGFHLKEWTYHELNTILLATGFRSISAYPSIRGKRIMFSSRLVSLIEKTVWALPRRLNWMLARRLLRMITVVATK